MSYLALILVFLRRSANNINLRGAQPEHVVNGDVLHGAVRRVDLNMTLVREGHDQSEMSEAFQCSTTQGYTTTSLLMGQRVTQMERWLRGRELNVLHALLEKINCTGDVMVSVCLRAAPPGWGSWGRWSSVSGDREPGPRRRRSSRGGNYAARATTPRAASAYQGGLWCRWSDTPGPASACMQNTQHQTAFRGVLTRVSSINMDTLKRLCLHTSTHNSESPYSKPFFLIWFPHSDTHTHTQTHTPHTHSEGCCRLPDNIDRSGADLGVAAHDWHTGGRRSRRCWRPHTPCPVAARWGRPLHSSDPPWGKRRGGKKERDEAHETWKCICLTRLLLHTLTEHRHGPWFNNTLIFPCIATCD